MYKLFLILRTICYIAAFICLFAGHNIVGYAVWDYTALFIDLGMAAVLALIGIVFSYIAVYRLKPPSDKDTKK